MKKLPFYTHGGFFHADEVTAYAILKLAGVCDRFIRLADISNIPDDGIVGDIGRVHDPVNDIYDHHHGLFRRQNGVPMATAGMVWQQFGEKAIVQCVGYDAGIPTEISSRVDKTLIEGIDAHDADNAYSVTATCSTGDKTYGEVRINTVSNIIAGFNSNDVADEGLQNERFFEAQELMQSVLRSHIRAAAKYVEASIKFERVATFHQDGKVIELTEGLPWREIVHEGHPDARYVIMPSNHPGNKFSMTAVTVSPESRECLIPIERPDWFNGFIHQGKWIAGANTVADLYDLAGWNIEWYGK